jgi:hypothetical protein
MLTLEDRLVFARLRNAYVAAYADTVLNVLHTSDRLDYRAMMAREVYAERAWRIYSVAVKPAHCVNLELLSDGEVTVRAEVEDINGEPLAS